MSEIVEAIRNIVFKGRDSAGQPRDFLTDILGRQKTVAGKDNGFRADIGVVAASGFAAEIIPPAAVANVTVVVHGIFISKPTALITVRIIKNETASTGGTSTNAVIVPLGAYDSRGTTVKIFTVAPTAGAALGDLAEHVVDTTDWMFFPFGEHGEAPLELYYPTDTLAVNVSAAATITGYIAFSEVQR